MNILSAFDGLSCGQIALRRAGIDYDCYMSSEIDSRAIRLTDINFPDTIFLGDIKQVKCEDIPPVDLLIGGSPCPSFALAGLRKGFDDPRGKLFFEFFRLLNGLKPKYFLFENVVMSREHVSVINSYLGVEPVMIDSALLSAQHRRRLYWTNIPFVGTIQDSVVRISDIVDTKVDFDRYRVDMETLNINYDGYVFGESDYAVLVERRTAEAKAIRKENMRAGRDYNPFRSKELVTRTDGKSNCLTVKSGITSILADVKRGCRYLTPLEWERLQTIPDHFTSGYFDRARYQLIGNAWTVNVVAELFRGLK